MITAVNRPAALHINLAAIKENTRQAKAHLKPGQKLFCVVKANAYGHGAARLAPVMEEAGADGFCVAMLDEGWNCAGLRSSSQSWSWACNRLKKPPCCRQRHFFAGVQPGLAQES